MSEKVLCEKSDLVAIADAVREATGSTENYNVSELSAATVEAISAGGSGGSLETCTVDVQAEYLFNSVTYTTGNGTLETIECYDQSTFSLNVCKNTILYGYGEKIVGNITISGDSSLLYERSSLTCYYVFGINGDCEISLDEPVDPFA